MSADNTRHAEGAGAAPVAALQTEVMTAVRGAISNAMAGQGRSLDLAGIDLDFSRAPLTTNLPVLLAKPDQALALPSASPAPAVASSSHYAIAAAVTVTLALGGASATAWLQGFPETSQRNIPVVAASLDAMPALVAPRTVGLREPVPEAEPEPELIPALATVATPSAPAVADVAARARSLLEAGQVQEARALLLGTTDAESADVAWILARSFDGNYLQSLGKVDATADSAEARRWYERWFDRAKRKGSVDKTVRLDRLLQSLK